MIDFIKKHYIVSIFLVIGILYSGWVFAYGQYVSYSIKNKYIFSEAQMNYSEAISYCQKQSTILIDSKDHEYISGLIWNGKADNKKLFQYGKYWMDGSKCEMLGSGEFQRSKMMDDSLKLNMQGIQTVITGKLPDNKKESEIKCMTICKKI